MRQTVTLALELEVVPCAVCGGPDVVTLGWLRDVALGVPGLFALATCRALGARTRVGALVWALRHRRKSGEGRAPRA